MPTVAVNGIEIAYERTGQGPAVLLITGVGYGGWYWHRVVPDLSQNFEVITFDNRGTGGSTKANGPYTVAMLAADAAGLLDALGLTGVHVVGHSLGGFIAQELAITRPDLINKLVLASTTHGGPNVVPITPEALEVLTNRQGDPIELIQRGIAIAAAPSFAQRQPDQVQALIDYRLTGPVPAAQYTAQVMAGAGMAMLAPDKVAERMQQITMPTLILFGENDNVVPPANADLFTAKLPHAHTVILPNTGHIFAIEDPAATVAALTEFLSQ